MQIHNITFQNKLIEQKVNFFANYFLYANEFIGSIPFLPLETHVSIIDKIIFQIKYNFTHCLKYIEYYINAYQHLSSDVLKITKLKYDLIKEKQFLIAEIKTLQNQNTKAKAKIIYIKKLKRFYQQLNNRYFDIVFDNLFETLISTKDLNYEINSIVVFSNSLLSYSRLKGISKKNITLFIGRIFREDPVLIKKVVSINKEYSDHSKFNGFKYQFYKIKDIVKVDEAFNQEFIFKIENCFPYINERESFKLNINKVTFISPFHNDIKELRSKAIANDVMRKCISLEKAFFSKENHLLALITVNCENYEDGFLRAIELVKNETLYLKLKKGNQIYVNEEDYLIRNKIEDWSFRLSHPKIKPRVSVEDFSNNNFVNNIGNGLYKFLISYDNLYNSALLDNSPSKLWQYLECIFIFQSIKGQATNKKVNQKVKNLLFDLAYISKYSMYWTLLYIIMPQHCSSKLLGFTDEERDFILSPFIGSQNVDESLKRLTKRINSIKLDFIKYLLKKIKQETSKDKRKRWDEYIENLLVEAYSVRNSEFHAGLSNDYTKIKLMNDLPKMVERIRTKLISKIVRNKRHKTFQAFINSI